MTDTLTRPGYDWIGYPTATETGPRCGRCQAPHINIEAIRDCHTIAYAQEEQADADARAEASYERHLEDRGYDAARAQDDYEARNGVIGFIEAWHAQSPDSCPCPNH